jgi:hypothetical protein
MKVELLLPAKKRKPGHPCRFQRIKKTTIEVAKPDSLEEALGNLLFLDARDLDRTVRRELLRILPVLIQSGRAWRARFAEYGCFSCHKKKVPYGSGGLCNSCSTRESHRIREWYRKRSNPDREIEAREALTRKYDVAQMLLNGNDEWPRTN